MRHGSDASGHQRAILVLTYTVVAAGIVAALYWAQAVFIPLALAAFLTLILTPLVMALERVGVPRTPAVLLVVLFSACLLGALGWVFTRQFVQLAADVPKYEDNIKQKIRDLRALATPPASGRFGKLIEEVTKEIERPQVAQPAAGAPQAAPSVTKVTLDAGPAPVVVQSPRSAWLGQAVAALATLSGSLASFALAIVLAGFMLLNRESMRDRIIRLIGQEYLTVTTKAFDEAVQRISRFLLMQLIVNGTYGIALAAGLLALGVEYALFWGLLAAVLRYIPYVGPWIAAIPPVLLSVVVSEGWVQPTLVVGWIVLVELVSNNIVEPLLYGQSLGVSEVALLVAAAFWAFLWGPLGLVLSSPLTVCLVVLGKYVPQLKFIDILLGDQPALEPHVRFYQRLLARDADEATQIAVAQAQSLGPQVFDQLIIPALSLFKRDRQKDAVTDDDEGFILKNVAEIIEELQVALAASRAQAAGALEEEPIGSPALAKVRLFICGASDEPDHLSLAMLRALAEPEKWHVLEAAEELLAAELVEQAGAHGAQVILIASLPPGGLAHARYLCKRLRASAPTAKIIVGRWGRERNVEATIGELREAGADEVEFTLTDTGQRLAAWWPMLSQQSGAGPDGVAPATSAPVASSAAR
jgi:predicted PurR-regulated permease PerM